MRVNWLGKWPRFVVVEVVVGLTSHRQADGMLASFRTPWKEQRSCSYPSQLHDSVFHRAMEDDSTKRNTIGPPDLPGEHNCLLLTCKKGRKK
mmetsp:Transcript_103/g.808  ORF Transcript_103/g.808 Transcript_103/m.808 type:complete len:92 (-) Transcript_103:1209-1484(-)